MRDLLKPRYWFLYAGLAFAGVVFVLVSTPIAWILGGRQPESYPELFYLGFGVPPALNLLIAGLVVSICADKGVFHRSLLPLWGAVLVTAVLAIAILTPARRLFPIGGAEGLLDTTFYFAWPLLFLWTVVASIASLRAWRRRKSG